ncbi:MAG: hypothetical protein WEA04_03875 [Candidatus Andersenbacteria bacterium]
MATVGNTALLVVISLILGAIIGGALTYVAMQRTLTPVIVPSPSPSPLRSTTSPLFQFSPSPLVTSPLVTPTPLLTPLSSPTGSPAATSLPQLQ